MSGLQSKELHKAAIAVRSIRIERLDESWEVLLCYAYRNLSIQSGMQWDFAICCGFFEGFIGQVGREACLQAVVYSKQVGIYRHTRFWYDT